MSAVGPRAFQPAAVGARFSRAAALAVSVFISALTWAQTEPTQALVTDAQRQHAAMMILLLVVVGALLTIGLLWWLRQKGLLPEERPRGPLDDLKDEIARRSDEMRKP